MQLHVSSPIHAFAYGVKVLNILIGSVSNCFLIVFYVKLYSYLLEYDYFCNSESKKEQI